MKIIDWYILRRYLMTFSAMLLLFIPIGIIIDISEKVNRMIERKAPMSAILIYYGDFIVYFANLLFPIFLFLSVIWFTSKLANNTEIIAILSSGISYFRFLRPFIMGAAMISFFALMMGFYLVPNASKGFLEFRNTYLKAANNKTMETADIFRQISDNEFIYVNSYNVTSSTGFNFTYEKFDKNVLIERITANRIKYNERLKKYVLSDYMSRKIGKNDDVIEQDSKRNIDFNFDPDELTPVFYIAETMTIGDLYAFINKEKDKGNGNVNAYLVILYKKFSLPVAAFILTIIAVAVSSMKRRGGMGINLALGICIAFIYIFLDKILGTVAELSSFPPIIAVWTPNLLFGILAIILLRNARR